MTKQHRIYRALFYAVGLIILSMGLTLNTKAGLGVSPITSISYSISEIFSVNFGDVTFAVYAIFVLLELIIHGIGFRTASALSPRERKLILLKDLLQFPLSLAFTRFLNLFGNLVPSFSSDPALFTQQIPLRLVMLILAIVLTGIGAAMSLSMRLVPNPGDGLVQTLADCTHKTVGFTKNCFDLVNCLITVTLGLLFAGQLVGIGVGTILAVIGVGRIIALFQRLAGSKLTQLSGVAI